MPFNFFVKTPITLEFHHWRPLRPIVAPKNIWTVPAVPYVAIQVERIADTSRSRLWRQWSYTRLHLLRGSMKSQHLIKELQLDIQSSKEESHNMSLIIDTAWVFACSFQLYEWRLIAKTLSLLSESDSREYWWALKETRIIWGRHQNALNHIVVSPGAAWRMMPF